MLRLIRASVLIVVGIAATACSTTPADLQAKTKPLVRTYAINYQEVYRRLSSTAKRCWSGNIGAQTSYEIDAELYGELGYGEVSFSLLNVGVRNYYWTAKIEKSGAGSRMTVNSGNTVAPSLHMNRVLRWANGDQSC